MKTTASEKIFSWKRGGRAGDTVTYYRGTVTERSS